MSRHWNITPSDSSLRTKNPIRAIVDNLKTQPHPDKPLISLSIGDPTVFGNFQVPASVDEAVSESLFSHKSNGYPHSCGFPEARAAVAKKFSHPQAPLTSDDVILASGCSHAIFLAIDVLANPGANILVPSPGFPLYEVICEYKGVQVKHYRLDPRNDWQVDLEHLESLVDDKTVAIVINNPSNPCGCVHSQEHLKGILAVAERSCVPIIADEIYANMVFSGSEFVPIATLTTEVPIFSVGGIAKQYLVPGWRVGWLLIHDRHDRIKHLRGPLVSLTQLILGCNSLIQASLPRILDTEPEFYTTLNTQLEVHAKKCVEFVQRIPGLRIVIPRGAMYVMIEILVDEFADIDNDSQFAEKLLSEESVFVLPGSCFRTPNFFRVVITPPLTMLETAFSRLAEFCSRHRKPQRN